jgi:hypothetical protein
VPAGDDGRVLAVRGELLVVDCRLGRRHQAGRGQAGYPERAGADGQPA